MFFRLWFHLVEDVVVEKVWHTIELRGRIIQTAMVMLLVSMAFSGEFILPSVTHVQQYFLVSIVQENQHPLS